MATTSYFGVVVGGEHAGQLYTVDSQTLRLDKPVKLQPTAEQSAAPEKSDLPAYYKHTLLYFVEAGKTEHAFGFWVPAETEYPQLFVFQELRAHYRDNPPK